MGPKEKQLKDAIVIKERQNIKANETIFNLDLTICYKHVVDNRFLEDPIQKEEVKNFCAERLISDARYLINGALAEKYNEKLQDAIRRSQNQEVMGSYEIKRIFTDMAFDIGISRNVIADALREMNIS